MALCHQNPAKTAVFCSWDGGPRPEMIGSLDGNRDGCGHGFPW